MGMTSALFSVLKAMLEDTAQERARAMLKREQMGAPEEGDKVRVIKRGSTQRPTNKDTPNMKSSALPWT